MKNSQKTVHNAYDGNAQVFYNARLIDVVTEDGADYLGDTKRVPTFNGSAERAAKEAGEKRKWFEPGTFGVIIGECQASCRLRV
jgi:hypothetical protein